MKLSPQWSLHLLVRISVQTLLIINVNNIQVHSKMLVAKWVPDMFIFYFKFQEKQHFTERQNDQTLGYLYPQPLSEIIFFPPFLLICHSIMKKKITRNKYNMLYDLIIFPQQPTPRYFPLHQPLHIYCIFFTPPFLMSRSSPAQSQKPSLTSSGAGTVFSLNSQYDCLDFLTIK